MPNIQFEIKELCDEFQLMQELASSFLREESLPILEAVGKSLTDLKSRRSPLRLEAKPDRPIKTRDSEGKYEKGEGGGYCVRAELYFVWELQPIIKPKSHRYAEVSGKASTVTKLYVNGSSSEIAHWRLEIGDNNSPGFYFHAQIPEAFIQDDGMWPKWLPVPRLPVPPFTPMLALEFVLGEIFQDEWPEYLERRSTKSNVGQWRKIHMDRFRKYLEWQQKAVGGSASPLMALKRAIPKSNIFIPA